MKKSSLILLISTTFIIYGCATTQIQSTNYEIEKNQKKNSDDVRLHIPVYDQKISIGLPNQSWKAVFETQNPNYRVEFIPKNEDPKDWQNLISVQGFKNMTAKAKKYDQPIRQFSQALILSTRLFCPKGKFVYEVIDEIENNNDRRLGILLGCLVPSKIKAQTKSRKGELGYYVFIAGEKDLYLIHKAVRGEENEIKRKLNKSNAQKFLSSIEPIKLCKKEGHMTECRH